VRHDLTLAVHTAMKNGPAISPARFSILKSRLFGAGFARQGTGFPGGN